MTSIYCTSFGSSILSWGISRICLHFRTPSSPPSPEWKGPNRVGGPIRVQSLWGWELRKDCKRAGELCPTLKPPTPSSTWFGVVKCCRHVYKLAVCMQSWTNMTVHRVCESCAPICTRYNESSSNGRIAPPRPTQKPASERLGYRVRRDHFNYVWGLVFWGKSCTTFVQ